PLRNCPVHALVPRAWLNAPASSDEGHIHLEQLFQALDLAPVGHEKDDVVVGLDPDVVVRDDHFLAPDDGADTRSPRQFDLLQFASDYPGTFLCSMRYCLDGFSGTFPERMHLDDVAAPDVRQQRSDRHLLWRDGNVDGP